MSRPSPISNGTDQNQRITRKFWSIHRWTLKNTVRDRIVFALLSFEIHLKSIPEWEKQLQKTSFACSFPGPQEHLFQQSVESPFKSSVQYLNFCQMSADYALSSANVQAFLKRTDQQFDLVINEEFFHDSYLMFGHKFKAPIVTISMSISEFCWGNPEFSFMSN